MIRKFFNRVGEKIDFDRWRVLSSTTAYTTLRWTVIDDITVSTVWLGLDQSGGIADKPHIFETLVFKDFNEEMDMMRYSTKEEAIAGHNQFVREIEGLKTECLCVTGCDCK